MSFWGSFKSLFSRAEEVKKESTGVVFLNTNVATWGNRDFLAYAKEGYLQNVIVYRCIGEIAKSVSSVEWSLFRHLPDGKKEQVHDPTLTKVLKRPNPNQGWSDFMFNAVAFLVLDGVTYIAKNSPETGENKNIPFEMQVQFPTQIKPVLKDNKILTGYELKVQGTVIYHWPIDPITRESDLLRMKSFHPLDSLYGASATEAAAREIDTSNEAINWHKALLENQGRPGMLLMYKDALGDAEFERVKKQLQAKHSGAHNVGKSLILENDATAKPYNFSPTELDFIEGSREKARNIAMAYSVPSQIIGIKGESTFANYKQAREAFWEDTVISYLNFFKTEFNNWLYDDPTLFLDYSLDDIPALAEKRQKQWENAQKADFLMINEKRAMVGKDEVDGGDVIFVSSNQIPLTDFSGSEDKEDIEEIERERLLEIGFSEEEIDDMVSDGM